MAVLAQTWIDATRRNLLGTFTELRNTLSANYTPGDGALTLSRSATNITPGTILSINLNTFYVWSVNGSVVTADGGQNGSTDIALTSGAIVRVNPKFTDFDIWQELTNELGALSGEGLVGYQSSDLTYNPVLTGYDLGSTAASNLLDIYEVKYLTPGPEKDMPRLPRSAWRLTRNANTTDIASGMGLQILSPSPQNVSGYTVRVVWKSTLPMPPTTATDLSTTLLQASAYDIPPIGAAINLMSGREVPRNFIQDQGDTRRAAEVPPGAIMQSTNGLKQRRQSRIATEKARLATMYAITAD